MSSGTVRDCLGISWEPMHLRCPMEDGWRECDIDCAFLLYVNDASARPLFRSCGMTFLDAGGSEERPCCFVIDEEDEDNE